MRPVELYLKPFLRRRKEASVQRLERMPALPSQHAAKVAAAKKRLYAALGWKKRPPRRRIVAL